MVKIIFKLTILILMLVLLVSHWNEVVAFFGGIIDWILFYMDKIAVGPPR